MLKKVKDKKYNQFLISAMNGIKKDHESIAKDYESFFTAWKINVKKFSRYISLHTLQFPSITRDSPAFMI